MDNLLQVCQELGIEAPISVGVRSGNLNNVFSKIVNVAKQPHLNIPETETGKKRKLYKQLVSRSLMCASGMCINHFSTFAGGWVHLLTNSPSYIMLHVCTFLSTFGLFCSWGCCCSFGTCGLSCLCFKEKRFELRVGIHYLNAIDAAG